MCACVPILAPNRRSTARRHPKQGRGLKRTSQRPKLQAIRRICSLEEYLRAARFATESMRISADRSLMTASYGQAPAAALQLPGLARDHVLVDGLQTGVAQAGPPIEKSAPPAVVVQELQQGPG